MTSANNNLLMNSNDLKAEIEQLLEHKKALLNQLRDIKRQKLLLQQRAARIRLQLAQRGLADL